MTETLPRLPERPFFSCEPHRFAVVDAVQMRDATALGSLEPVCAFSVGPSNVFEQIPRAVTSHDARYVRVACEGGEVVTLDFVDLTARKETPEREFVYKGGLDEAGDGLGFMRAH